MTHTGQLGVVLFCDEVTNQKAISVANAAPQGNEIKLGTQHRPHVTLYHSKLKDVPEDVVNELLNSLRAKLPVTLQFTQTAVFGGKFLFWDTERTSQLVQLHEIALRLAHYFVPAGEQQADKEKISLHPGEDENVRLYGHPLVRGFWRPHITVGYYPTGITLDIRQEKFTGKTYGVAFIAIADRKDRSIMAMVFLVDTFCLGVKNVMEDFTFRSEPQFESMLSMMYIAAGFPEIISFDLARQILFGSVAYARKLGFEPHPDFEHTKRLLGNVEHGTPDVQFGGPDGKPLYVVGPDDDAEEIIRTLESRVGRDGFSVVRPDPMDVE